MKDTLIVGVGSPHGDDRAGWLVIQALDAALAPAERAAARLTTLALDRPGMALVEYVRGAERVVVVDALQGRDAPGALVIVQAEDLQRGAGATSTHGFGVAEAWALGATLKLIPEASMLIGITIAAHALEGDVGAPVRRAAARLAEELAHWIRAGGEAWPPRLGGVAPWMA